MIPTKFRVWDEDSEKMIYEVGIDPSGIPYSIPEGAEDYMQFDYYPYAPFMLWSGLKDKNGEEIYEGDIIIDNEGFIWVVEFKDGMFSAEGGEYDTTLVLAEFCPDWCEVVGNIYKNPDYLTDE